MSEACAVCLYVGCPGPGTPFCDEMRRHGTNRDGEFPVAVTLRFRDDAARLEFFAGLIDGWGEGQCEVDWPWKDGKAADVTDVFYVDVTTTEE